MGGVPSYLLCAVGKEYGLNIEDISVGIHRGLIPNWTKLTPARILFTNQYITKSKYYLDKYFENRID